MVTLLPQVETANLETRRELIKLTRTYRYIPSPLKKCPFLKLSSSTVIQLSKNRREKKSRRFKFHNVCPSVSRRTEWNRSIQFQYCHRLLRISSQSFASETISACHRARHSRAIEQRTRTGLADYLFFILFIHYQPRYSRVDRPGSVPLARARPSDFRSAFRVV